MSDVLDGLDEFDRWIQLAATTGADPEFRQALVNVHDTLMAARKSATVIFKERATPELALKICEQMMAEHARIERDRRNLERELNDDE